MELSEKQKFIIGADNRLIEADKKILKEEMEDYRKKFGWAKEDHWLWLAGCGNRNLEVSFVALDTELIELKVAEEKR